ncbi:hypothetical protein SAMN04489860_0180 [Paraoerskovia marina]|uniref:VOC domain-containing protein n=1 Tax=Paraoerskovia marina TaxID=545619 RepID=A0A1H1MA17_9CELL|nr:VOC family protein [Paraoerskovia marina]SDR83633.1 hypothetical protein SAMN04489860_0180 [Paraoerskovia marina]
MPATPDLPVGAPCWNDLGTPDLDTTVAFYTDLFGWGHLDYGEEYGHYGAFTLDDVPIAGVGPNAADDAVSAWNVYLKVADVKDAVERSAQAGATVLVPPMEVPAFGANAFVTDPSGAVVGLWEARGHNGFGRLAEVGAPAWHELLTRDYAAAVDFYRDVLGWTINVQGDTDEFRYSVFQPEGGDQHAGIMDASGWLDEKVGAHWSVYFLIDDADETCNRAVELGGGISMAPEDSPYGRMAVLTDPLGAQFKVITAANPPA